MIAAIVLAAGQSRRMGRNKMLLPFGASTVIETVVNEVAACAAVRDMIIVTGHQHNLLEARLAHAPVRCVFNPAYAHAEMLISIQVGLRALPADSLAALVVLGDQPRLQSDIVRRVIDAYAPDTLIIPSYQMKRGHPILIDRALWADVLSLPDTATLRDFIQAHAKQIRYVEVETDSVLADLDTPEDYQEAINRKDGVNFRS
jgi:molybdenum cofactor cytidylyltransferase